MSFTDSLQANDSGRCCCCVVAAVTAVAVVRLVVLEGGRGRVAVFRFTDNIRHGNSKKQVYCIIETFFFFLKMNLLFGIKSSESIYEIGT